MEAKMTNEERTLLPEIVAEAAKLNLKERAVALGFLIAKASEAQAQKAGA
ncbi:MAG: hypothetical protein MJ097_00625 [Dorea sp.]|nr:hypothetical protein [Dorea sp.]